MPDLSADVTLTVWATDPERAQPVVRALERKHDVTLLSNLPEPDQPLARLLIFYRAPVAFLCRAMQAGEAPSHAMQSWLQETRRVLALNRRNRRAVRLVDTDAALTYPQAFRAAFDLPEEDDASFSLRNDQDDPILLTLAERMLLRDPQSRALMAELEAASLNLGDTAGRDFFDPDAVLRVRRRDLSLGDELKEVRAELAELTERYANLEASEQDYKISLQASQSQVGELSRECDRLQAEVSEQVATQSTSQEMIKLMQSQLSDLTQELERLARRNTELEAEASKSSDNEKMLRERLQAKERSLEAADIEMKRAAADQAAQITDLHGQLHHAHGEIDRFYRSRSYRITAPLRRLRAMFVRG